jgi:hypothetical protein
MAINTPADRPDRGGARNRRAGGSAVAALPARPQELRNRYRDVEHGAGGLQVLAARPLVRVVRDRRNSAELVGVVSDQTCWTLSVPGVAE